MKPMIQVAGVRDINEQAWLYDAGVRWFGYPFFISPHLPENTLHQIESMIKALPHDAMAVWIHYLSFAAPIVSVIEKFECEAIQCHGDISIDELKKIKKACPDIFIIKSLVIGGSPPKSLMETVQTYADYVDCFITDTYDAVTGATGATGLVHDWAVSQQLIEASEKPVMIAGGLNQDNVYDAILQTKPAGVDAHTGLETLGGRKCKMKVAEFLSNSLKGFEAITPCS